MTSLGPRFCPRCGTARVADMPFCPGCGLNVAELADGATPGAGTSPSTTVNEWEGGRSPDSASPTKIRSPVDRGFRVPPVVLVALMVIIGLVALGLLFRPQLGGSPASEGRAAPGVAPGDQPVSGVPSGGPPAPIVGLTILSPTDGQAVATKDVTVIGTAPPGLTVTQDISFGFDQHTTVDGTGHWAIKVDLNVGENNLAFRIGDDASTRQTMRVIYTPQ